MSNAEDVLKSNIFVMDWIREITKDGEIEGRITVDGSQIKDIMRQYRNQTLQELKAKVEEEKERHEEGFDRFDDGITQGMRYVITLIDEAINE